MNISTYIKKAKEDKSAIGHFNISNIEMFNAVVSAVREMQVPVFIGVSEGERNYIGLNQVVSLVQSVKNEGLPIFLNADHTYSFEAVKSAVDAGFDTVIFDGAGLPIEENIEITKKCVDYAHDREVLVEGELGYIGKSSKMLDEVPDGIEMTSVGDALYYVKETGVDFLAPAVGNIHGMLKGANNPGLDIERIKSIKEAVGIPLVLHGGSGTSDEDFRSAIDAGIDIIHVSTEMRVAYRKALEETLLENPDDLAPYRLGAQSLLAVQDVVMRRMKLFNNI